MSNIDRALRTLSRMQSAAPPAAANRIGEVITLLQRLNSENEYLNAQFVESLHTSAGTNISESAYASPAMNDLFRVDPGPVLELFGDIDPALFTDEMPAVSADAAPTQSQFGYLTHLDTTMTERVPPEEPNNLPNADELLIHLDDVLRPALLTMLGQAEALFESRLGRLTSNQSDALRLMVGNATSLMTLLDSLTLVQQLRHQTLALETAVFDPISLLENAQQNVRERASAYDHQLNVQADDSLPMVQADFGRMLVIFTDILDNAIRYTPPDGIIRISADNLGTHVLFTVSDVGIGLSTDETELVGTPFWRALHQPLVLQHPGTGLRLFLAKRILALQGGELFFSGEPGFGSSFSFTLPAAEAE
jgi:signal transduction histidine kinase